MYQIFVVEDELLIRQNIRNIIENMAGPYVFCGEASDGEMALSMMQELMPDIVLTDIRMPFLDGFDLIRHAKEMMPWLRVIIISGYDDFEYARKAISLGVDQYLLKPVRQADLTKAVEQLARQIDATRAQATLPHGYDTDELRTALRQHMMQQILHGSADTGVLLERARTLQMNIVHQQYQTVIFDFDSGEQELRTLQVAIENVLSQMKAPLYYFGEAGRLTLLLCGNDDDAFSERVYQSVNILRHELRALCPVITTVIGSPVRRLSAVCDAYKETLALLRKGVVVSAGQVIDIGDTSQLMAELAQGSSPFGEEFQQRLQAASPQEVSALVDEVLRSEYGRRFDSMLVRYNALTELLRLTVQMISRVRPGEDAKDIAAHLSDQHGVIEAAGKKESFRQAAVGLLEEAVSARLENSGSAKYGHIISRAERYVAENFCDPNISLLSVARHVGMSSAHFSTVFSQSQGRSFINYLTQMRIERAKELLAGTSMKLSSIAMEIGYNEPNYFSHVFRKVEGITPKEYRNRCHAGQ